MAYVLLLYPDSIIEKVVYYVFNTYIKMFINEFTISRLEEQSLSLYDQCWSAWTPWCLLEALWCLLSALHHHPTRVMALGVLLSSRL